ncbi:hypothetical protein AHMF7605_08435 [Adhaeribacter arboris]|uniref:Uncharacterized protein n=1 Tax=Adhaeribacter arboris TaxID=2072846 RepID=A0A2T2YDG1_9BACT|nr:hypothetical protein [Adhaeribacter arboris]PSR53550.1 hypothetical protein AHMF7605_08435 [Adhaeribacter arboris]
MIVKAGPVQALYDKGFLRYIQTAGHEVVRMIYFAVRDQDWETILGTLTDEHIHTSEDTFSISYTYHLNHQDIKMKWQAKIKGQADGTITFDLKGFAQSNFLRNRAGFCVLHPITGITGQSCRLEHPDGSFTYGTFPIRISPHQPFLNLKAMEWPVAEQGVARLEFSGDIFESEDQRNWSDASYKTYCTPLSKPIPAQVHSGDEIQQQVVFRLVKPVPVVTTTPTTLLSRIHVHPQPIAFPELGLGMNSFGSDPNANEVHFLQSLGLKHLRADVFLNQAHWREPLKRSLHQSTILTIPLELALFFGEDASEQVHSFVNFIQAQAVPLQSILIFDAAKSYTTDALLQKVVPALRTTFPGVPLGGGSDANFTEFNRHPFTLTSTDFVVYAINPQVHAFDDLTLIENTASQADTVESARHIAGKRPIHLSPVTLKPRFNAIVSSDQNTSTIPTDPRQPTSFISGWTLASLKYLTEAGAASITYFETTGPNGIYHQDQPYAVGYLLAYILAFKPIHVLPTNHPEPLKITSFLLRNDIGSCLLIANHTSEPQVVELPENFIIHTHTIIGTATGKATYPNYLPGSQLTLSAFQTVALDGALL